MRRPNPAVIGAFVIGAIALAVAALLFFGGGVLREKRMAVVSFFDGSVAGLRVGAPVTFRGVPVGEVKAMGVRINPQTGRSIIQVDMQLMPDRVTVYGVQPPREVLLAALVRDGLTAQLVNQSLVTGMLSVELAFRPGAEVSRFGDTGLPEIPTVPGELEALRKQLQSVDIAAAVESLQRTLASVDAVMRNPGLKQGLDRLPSTLATLERTLKSVEREVGASSAGFQETLGAVRSLAASVERDSATTSAALRGTLTNADAVLEGAHAFVDPQGHTAVQAQRAVDDLAATAARLRNLAERLDRDPSVLVRGR
jgi:phospholipid/cholesterol/gamma-HCH transport system substrate-binding protein